MRALLGSESFGHYQVLLWGSLLRFGQENGSSATGVGEWDTLKSAARPAVEMGRQIALIATAWVATLAAARAISALASGKTQKLARPVREPAAILTFAPNAMAVAPSGIRES